MQCQVRDLNLYYEETGSGRPLLLLHGRPLDHRHIASDIEPLFAARPGWRRIYPDLPGMGKTPGADWITHQDHMLDVVLEFIDTVAPGERFVVVGSSYGAHLARGLVYQRGAQIDGVLLNVPMITADDTTSELPQLLVVREDPAFLAALTPEEQTICTPSVSRCDSPTAARNAAKLIPVPQPGSSTSIAGARASCSIAR